MITKFLEKHKKNHNEHQVDLVKYPHEHQVDLMNTSSHFM